MAAAAVSPSRTPYPSRRESQGRHHGRQSTRPLSASSSASSTSSLPAMEPSSTAPRAWRLSVTMLTLLLLSWGARTSLAQDPIKDFCRRFGHQTAVIDRKLYIDGGLLNYDPLSKYPDNYTNVNLLWQDLDNIAAAGMPTLYNNLTKNSSVPSVIGGALWADDINKRIYLFGGMFHYGAAVPETYTLWSYDPLNDIWDSYGIQQVTSAAFGAATSVSDRGEGYYYGGWMTNQSISGWGPDKIATSYITKYSMDDNTFTNSSGPDDIRRAEGVMVYLPVSDGGMLIYFGGVQDPYLNGTAVPQPMDQILLYDLDASRWYTQNATGDVPPNRRLFCAGAAWAPDQSSYNIYLYGGATAGDDGPGFDDIYILTLPSFQWIKLWEDTATDYAAHNSLTCNVIDGTQMIIIGGYFPSMPDHCDAQSQWGTHNMDMAEQNANHAAWNLFQTNETSYVVPTAIIDAVGGGPTGGATATAPSSGFANSNLGLLMTRKASVSQRTATRAVVTATSSHTSAAPSPSNDSSSSLSGGAIAGIVVGGIAVAALLLTGCFFFAARRHRKNKMMMDEPPSDASPQAVHNETAAAWSPGHYADVSHSSSQMVQSRRNTTTSQPASPYPSHSASPIELEAAPGSTVWHSPDGMTYGLVAPAGSVSPTASHMHDNSFLAHLSPSPYSPTGSPPPLPAYYPSNSIPLGPGGEIPPTKVDSAGRVWVALSPPSATPSRENGEENTWYSRGSSGQGGTLVEPQELPGHYHQVPTEDGTADVSAASLAQGGGYYGGKKARATSISASSGAEPRLE